ncbi:MAG: hypothetical protein GU359_04185 [Desulfurococcales archaeon]|nr:hypothetical protein [Desulfurococcales archaeon]
MTLIVMAREDVYKLLYEAFDKRPVFISKNKRILSIILRYHVKHLLGRYSKIFIKDLWGWTEDFFRSRFIEENILERIVLGHEDPMILIIEDLHINKYKDLVQRAVAIYSGSGRGVYKSLGYDPVVKIFASIREGVYMIQGLMDKVLLIKIEGDRFVELSLSQKYQEAVKVLSEAFDIYGSYKQSDAVKILMRELGLDRVEAQKILRYLYENGVIKIDKGGYIVIGEV